MEADMETSSGSPTDGQPLETLSTRELVAELAKRSTELVKKQVVLAQAELRADVKREVVAFAGFGIAGGAYSRPSSFCLSPPSSRSRKKCPDGRRG
jgi:hypothetical protein